MALDEWLHEWIGSAWERLSDAEAEVMAHRGDPLLPVGHALVAVLGAESRPARAWWFVLDLQLVEVLVGLAALRWWRARIQQGGSQGRSP